jgi:hypothetical protein
VVSVTNPYGRNLRFLDRITRIASLNGITKYSSQRLNEVNTVNMTSSSHYPNILQNDADH